MGRQGRGRENTVEREGISKEQKPKARQNEASERSSSFHLDSRVIQKDISSRHWDFWVLI